VGAQSSVNTVLGHEAVFPCGFRLFVLVIGPYFCGTDNPDFLNDQSAVNRQNDESWSGSLSASA
jgi:hypothetical protein